MTNVLTHNPNLLSLTDGLLNDSRLQYPVGCGKSERSLIHQLDADEAGPRIGRAFAVSDCNLPPEVGYAANSCSFQHYDGPLTPAMVPGAARYRAWWSRGHGRKETFITRTPHGQYRGFADLPESATGRAHMH